MPKGPSPDGRRSALLVFVLLGILMPASQLALAQTGDYSPTPGTGLNLNVASGYAVCGSPPTLQSYTAGTVTLTASTTNYVYLDRTSGTCAPAANTSGFTTGDMPIAVVVTGSSSITSVTDVRAWFRPNACGGVDSSGNVTCAALANGNLTLMPGGTSGKVGIGTTAPSYPLDVNANVIGVGTKVPSGGFGGSLRIRDDNGDPRWLVGILGSSGATDFNIRDMNLDPSSPSNIAVDKDGQIRANRQAHDATPGTDFTLWGKNYVHENLSAGAVSEGVNGQIVSQDAITSDPPSDFILTGLEGAALVWSTGSTLPDVRGLTANVNYWTVGDPLNSDTNITDVKTIVAQQFHSGDATHDPGNGTVDNAYGLVAERQIGGRYRNYSIWSQGDILLSWTSTSNGQSIASTDAGGAIHKVIRFGGTEGPADTIDFTPLNDSNGIRWSNAANGTEWMRLVNGQLGIGTASPASTLHVSNPLAANDTTTEISRFGGGTDSTLGPLVMTIRVHPSAAASNRYVELGVGDSLGNHPLTVRSNVNVGIGTSAPALALQVAKAMGAGLSAITTSGTSQQIDASTANTFVITLGYNGTTTATLSNCQAGEWLVFDIVGGGSTKDFAWSTTYFHGGGTVTKTSGTHNRQMFYCDGTNNNGTAWAVSAMWSGT
jgi:hypothetical protein